MQENIMIKIGRGESCVAFSTYSRKLGRHGRFLVLASSLQKWLDSGAESAFHDSDCGNDLRITCWKDTFCMQFDWLSEFGSGELRGWRQRVYLDRESFMFAVTAPQGLMSKYLSNAESPRGNVYFVRNANKVIAGMDGKTRRAFAKAMARGALQWPNTNTTVYADGRYDFFFRTDDGMCGGLIRHENKRDRVYYGVHT